MELHNLVCLKKEKFQVMNVALNVVQSKVNLRGNLNSHCVKIRGKLGMNLGTKVISRFFINTCRISNYCV